MSFPPANYHADIDPTGERVKILRDEGPEGPIVMLNLLKFKDKADYPEGHPNAGSTGAEAYRRYEKLFTETVGDISQAQPLYDGPVMHTLVGSAAEGDWDRMLIVRYPSRKHFLAMMADETYRDGLVHRYAGLERTILLQCGANSFG
ncbi:DUF1330 domain-containing protein [Sandaracinobacteroides hominis]|uniref:DUF1330 domain-containing protein n=1 Tax=Sandaracinobacteroides hominis TaxID=2780086 RepID=UPI0018F7CE55|nr:DUF1330 domain-containing protein [Sandaracinobacteroides hominis]